MKIGNFDIDRRQIIILVFATVMLLALFVYWQFFYLPKKKDIDDILRKVKDFDVNIKEEEVKVRAKGYEEEIAKMQQEVARLRKKFPSRNELPRLIQEIFNQADKFNVEIISIEPDTPEVYKSDVASKSDLIFNRIPISLELRASYRALAEFLKVLFENPQYAFSFDSLTLEKKKGAISKLDIKLELGAFVLSHKGASPLGKVDVKRMRR